MLRPRAVPQQQPRVPASGGGQEGSPPAARHAVHELGRVRHDHGRRRQGARAAQPFCLMKPPVDDAGQTKPNHTRSGSLDWPPCDVMFVWTICPGGQAFSLVAGDGKAVFHSFLAAALDFIFILFLVA